MRVIRHPEVSQELEAAALWYEERRRGYLHVPGCLILLLLGGGY